jgi:oxygen-dependent protoporphyrinogen oxidase
MTVSVVVVGGGISGLATAYFLRQQLGTDATITVVEESARLGGKVLAREIAGLTVDTGPDAFLSRAPALALLIDQLDLRNQIVSPATVGAYIWSRGKLRPLPPGANFGLPERVIPLVRSGLISIPGAFRALFDLVLPKRDLPTDHSVEDLLRPRLGTEIYHRMVEPMLGGVHAGSSSLLSAPSTIPEIESMAKSGRSLLITMRKRKKKTPKPVGKPGSALISFAGGISTLTNTLATNLGEDSFLRETTVLGITYENSGYKVETNQATLFADHVVLATPAFVSAELLKELDFGAAELLDQIPYVDSAAVILAFKKSAIPPLPSGTGFLIPPIENEFIVGVTWLTSKWPQLVNEEVVVVRNLVGRYGDKRWLDMDDSTIIANVCEGLLRMMNITVDPIAFVIQRWPKAMPQYVVGHGARLEAIESSLEKYPGLHITGAAYRGVGLAGCVAQAEQLARKISEGILQ